MAGKQDDQNRMAPTNHATHLMPRFDAEDIPQQRQNKRSSSQGIFIYIYLLNHSFIRYRIDTNKLFG